MINYIMKKYALSRQGAKDLIVATISCVVHNLMLMLPVSLLYFLVSDLYEGGVPQSHLWIYIVGMIAGVLLILFSYRWVYGATYYATYKESSVRRISLAEKLRKLPLSFFGKKDLSDLTTTIMADCTTLEQSFSHWVPEFFGAMISTVLVAICLFVFDWRMALAVLWVLPVSLAIVAFSGKVQNYFTRKQTEAKLAVADGIQEALETMRDLKSNNAEGKYLDVLDKKIDKMEGRMIKSELGAAMFVVPASMILKLGMGTVALVGGILLAEGTLTVLSFFMFLLVASRLYDPLASSLQNLAAIISTRIPIERMNSIENYPVQPGTDELKTKDYDIVFENVSFSYNTGEQVLNNVSFTAKQGDVTALIGPSGGGKSTAAKLAARFWDADSGKITIGGQDVRNVDPEKLLSAYSIVFQDVTLFNNTVMENIRIGRQGATDAEVLAAAKEAQCDEFVEKLPEGYQAMIGENGSMLSGGERQRISIARALLKDSPVILLDEATASLDAENETQIQKAISRLVKGKTVLIIAHRMRTVEGADKLVLLQEGKVAEQGTPQELFAKGGLYTKMCKLQQQSGNWKV